MVETSHPQNKVLLGKSLSKDISGSLGFFEHYLQQIQQTCQKVTYAIVDSIANRCVGILEDMPTQSWLVAEGSLTNFPGKQHKLP